MKNRTDKKDTMIRILSSHRKDITAFGVRSLYLFGSVARGEATEQSDVDVLVEFASSPGFDGYMGLKLYLEDLLGQPVDLVMNTALRPSVRPIVEQEAVRVT